jgi:hypothetical protein
MEYLIKTFPAKMTILCEARNHYVVTIPKSMPQGSSWKADTCLSGQHIPRVSLSYSQDSDIRPYF